MNEQMNYIQEDEIDLKELFKTIWAKRWFIVIFTVMVTMLSIVYAYMKTPVFEVKSNVRIGYIGDELIENPDTIVKILNIVFNVEDKIASKEKPSAEATSITTNKNLKDFIEIKTQAVSNKEALKKNKEVVAFLQNHYQPTIDEHIKDKLNTIQDLQNRVTKLDTFEKKNIQNQIEILKTQKIAKINEQIAFLSNQKIPTLKTKIDFYKNNLNKYIKEIKKLYSKNTNSTETTIISIQMVNYQNLILNAKNAIEDLNLQILDIQNNQILSLQREKENINNDSLRKLEYSLNVELEEKKIKLNQNIEKLKYVISSQNIQNSMVVGEYIVNDYPVKPKKKLIVVVAFVTGFILSIFLVFFMEFIKGLKKEEEK